MSVKYHNTPNGPARCRAEVKACPYGAAGQPHFARKDEAQAAYEKAMTKTFGHSSTRRASRPRPVGTPTDATTARGASVLAGLKPSRAGRQTLKPLGQAMRGMVRKATPKNAEEVKKLLGTKYYLPDPESDKWKTSEYA